MTTAPNSAPRLTLLVRAYCHLCDEMRAALLPLLDGSDVVVDEFDVDADPALEKAWGDQVPALLAGTRELCHYHLDRNAVLAYLAQTSS